MSNRWFRLLLAVVLCLLFFVVLSYAVTLELYNEDFDYCTGYQGNSIPGWYPYDPADEADCFWYYYQSSHYSARTDPDGYHKSFLCQAFDVGYANVITFTGYCREQYSYEVDHLLWKLGHDGEYEPRTGSIRCDHPEWTRDVQVFNIDDTGIYTVCVGGGSIYIDDIQIEYAYVDDSMPPPPACDGTEYVNPNYPVLMGGGWGLWALGSITHTEQPVFVRYSLWRSSVVTDAPTIRIERWLSGDVADVITYTDSWSDNSLDLYFPADAFTTTGSSLVIYNLAGDDYWIQSLCVDCEDDLPGPTSTPLASLTPFATRTPVSSITPAPTGQFPLETLVSEFPTVTPQPIIATIDNLTDCISFDLTAVAGEPAGYQVCYDVTTYEFTQPLELLNSVLVVVMISFVGAGLFFALRK